MAKLEDQKLVKELLDIGLITKDRLIKIQEIAKQTLETDGITKTLLKNLDLDEDKLAEIIAKTFNVPYLQELNGLSCVSVPGLSKSDFVLKFKMIPIIIDNNEITLATINPPYQNILELIQKMTNLHLVPVILSASLYDRLVESIVKDVKLSKAIKIDFE